MKRSYRYIFRYQIDPFYEAAERIAELVKYCRVSEIDEVMLMLFAEELNDGHPEDSDLDPWIALARNAKVALAKEGVQMSLNPWTTIHHTGRGRILKPGQNFRLMIGENGCSESVSTCPLCDCWQDYLSETFARLATEISPTALWIEDDWRLHNHSDSLGWGGCFCDEHLRLFSERAGEMTTCEQLLEKLLAPGAPHPWRSIWIDLNHETLITPLRKVAARLRRANPEMRIGLMSSSPDEHSIEGRRWSEFQHALADEEGFLTRPHLPPYFQRNSLLVSPAITRHSIANLQRPLSLFPELESSPRNGLYSKSHAYTQFQMLQAALIGSHGITINHYDLMGTGITPDRSFGALLASAKPRLNEIANLKLNDEDAHGVRVIFSPEIACHRRLDSPKTSIHSLAECSTAWSNVFFPLGIAHGVTASIYHNRGVIAVSNQTLRAFSDQEIESLLRGAVLLDATSAEILIERGFGRLIGMESCRWRSLSEAAYSYEQIEEGDPCFYGIRNPRLSSQLCNDVLLELSPRACARPLSFIKNARNETLWPGATMCENELGGRVAVVTYSLDVKSDNWFLATFCSPYRKKFLSRILFALAPDATLADAGDHPMHAYRAPIESGTLLACLNATDDPAPCVVWNLPKGQFSEHGWILLGPDGIWTPILPTIRHLDLNDQYHFPTSVPALKDCLLIHQRVSLHSNPNPSSR